ncbi:PAS domain S-box protein [Aquimarina pacifica]|uniref:PAS domain S-box protein n=1 Tax=Aquimarina pacifica TaxID=1296415 RepID=UPI000470296F|nr:PAS domain S-box protein [Aquimarina pacifica]
MYKNSEGNISTTFTTDENYLKKELYQLVKTKESIFDFIQESALDGLWFWDLDNPENEWMNARFWTTLGYDPDSMPHTSSAWQEIINKDDLALALKNFHRHCKDSSFPYEQIVRYTHKLGHTVWIQCKGIILRDDQGRPTRMLGAHIDVTKLKKVKFKLRKQIERYEHIIEGTNIGTWEWNLQTDQIIFNERWAEMLGYSLTELDPITINTWTDIIHPEDRRTSRELLAYHCEGKTPHYECEIRLKHKKGNWIWVLDRAKILSRMPNGTPEWVIGSYQEITQRKNDLNQYMSFIEQAPSAIAMLDTNICYIAHSKKWKIDYNIKDEDIIGKSHYDIFPEIGEAWKKDHQDCLSGITLKNDEEQFERADGSIQWISWELRPWYKDDKKIGGIIMMTTDITKTKEIEIQLKLSEKRFRGNFENAATGMAIVDLDGKWIEVNTSLCDMLGYTAKELKTYNFREVTYPDDREIGITHTKELLDNKRSFFHAEKRYQHKNGVPIHALVSVSLIRNEEENPLHFIVQITNITPRVKAREKLQETLAQLEGLLEASTQVSIISTDIHGMITKFNKGAENLLGYNKEDIINKKTIDLIHLPNELMNYRNELPSLVVKNSTDFDILITNLNQTEYNNKEWTYLRNDGTQFPVQLSSTTIKSNNVITGYLFVATNISEIKKVEKEIKSLLEVANDQNERLKNFAHIVSHNLKSHSGNFSMLLDLYIKENPEFEENEIIELFKLASNNLSDTITHLNEVVLMNTAIDQNLVSLNLFNSINKITTSTLLSAKNAKVEITNTVDPTLNIKGISAYLDSILLNFITNGIKYRSQERDSYIKLSSCIENDNAILSIEDNGLGIDLKKHHSKLFGMYKTFHKNKEARGIGLFISKNQVEAIGGKIEVESEVNKGTTFKIYMKHDKN